MKSKTETRTIADRIAEIERELNALYGSHESGTGEDYPHDAIRRWLDDGPDNERRFVYHGLAVSLSLI